MIDCVYQFTVNGICPIDRSADKYEVTINLQRMVPVERLLKFSKNALKEPMFQEDYAVALQKEFGGYVTVTGSHKHVKTTCYCSPPYVI